MFGRKFREGMRWSRQAAKGRELSAHRILDRYPWLVPPIFHFPIPHSTYWLGLPVISSPSPFSSQSLSQSFDPFTLLFVMPSGPKWLDHQHAQMYLWRHRSSATDNSETSVESVFSNDGWVSRSVLNFSIKIFWRAHISQCSNSFLLSHHWIGFSSWSSWISLISRLNNSQSI